MPILLQPSTRRQARMGLASSRGGLLDISTELVLWELEPDPVRDLRCGQTGVQAGKDVVEGWYAGYCNGCEHHCLADCFPVYYVPYMLVRSIG